MVIVKDSHIHGKRVILEDASDIGVITDVYVDTSDWRITKFDVKLEKRYAERMGLDPPLIKKMIIPIRIHFLKSVGDVVHLKGDVDDIAKSQKRIVAGEPPSPPSPPKKPATPPKKAPPKKPAPSPPPKERTKPRKL
jgi:sporulation protein YlmC with PRC-barrel domain